MLEASKAGEINSHTVPSLRQIEYIKDKATYVQAGLIRQDAIHNILQKYGQDEDRFADLNYSVFAHVSLFNFRFTF